STAFVMQIPPRPANARARPSETANLTPTPRASGEHLDSSNILKGSCAAPSLRARGHGGLLRDASVRVGACPLLALAIDVGLSQDRTREELEARVDAGAVVSARRASTVRQPNEPERLVSNHVEFYVGPTR